MGARIAWAKGGSAEVVRLEGDAVTLRSTVPAPPGARLEGALEAGGEAVRVKVHSSRKQEDGAFVIEGRGLDMTREVRGKLAVP